MTFTNNIISPSASWKEHQVTNQARESSLALLGSSSFLHNWNRDHRNLELTKFRQHPPLWSLLTCYQDSLNMADLSQILKIQASLASIRAHSINSSPIKDALLLLDAQTKMLDINFSRMLLRYPAAFSQPRMENLSPMQLGMSHSIYGLNDGHLLNKKRNRSPLHRFPHRLHEIISNPEYSDYITWLPHGYAWKIVNRKQFEAVVIPRHFRHGRFTSFMRQVRMNFMSRYLPNFAVDF